MFNKDYPVLMMNYVRVGLDQFQMKELPSLSAKPFKLNLKMGPLDDSVSSQGDQIILTPRASDLANFWASTPSPSRASPIF